MSHTYTNISNDSFSSVKKSGCSLTKNLRKGDRLNIFVERHEGDDSDGSFEKVGVIETINKYDGFCNVAFEGISCDDMENIQYHSGCQYIKKVKKTN